MRSPGLFCMAYCNSFLDGEEEEHSSARVSEHVCVCLSAELHPSLEAVRQ